MRRSGAVCAESSLTRDAGDRRPAVATRECVLRSASEIACRSGARLTIRPIEVDDVERLARMFGRLSPETVYFRFFSPIRRLPHATLQRLVDVDHRRSEALVALDGDEIVAVARYGAVTGSGGSDARAAEVALTVEDAWQQRGVGHVLARRLGALASERGYDAFVARILPGNRASLAFVRRLVPDASVKFVDGDYEARVPLTALRPRRTVASGMRRRFFSPWHPHVHGVRLPRSPTRRSRDRYG
jgi:GNAT superfamily N-acetyltransferase